MYSLPEQFSDFLVPDCDRAAFIRTYLSDRGVDTSVVPISGKSHIYVNFPSGSYNPMFKMKTVLAHYDRVAGSPGANDNSAAVFSVMDWAVSLSRQSSVHNIRIFFTDGEELGGTGGVREQGAFGIATLFRKLGITGDDVYVFDACGRGVIPVVARTASDNAASPSFLKRFDDLYNRTTALIRSVSPGEWLTLPVPYSDNAGFLACGIPAVVVTLLPESEANAYMRELLRTKNLEAAVMNRASSRNKELPAASFGSAAHYELHDFEYREKMPDTWRLFHTEYDNALSLTPESFALMSRILAALAAEKTMA